MSLGGWLFAIGSILVILGTLQLQRETLDDTWKQAGQLLEITRLLKAEPDLTKEIVQEEADTRLIIDHMSESEKHFLAFTVRDPMKDPLKVPPQQIQKMLKAFADDYQVAGGGNPFLEMLNSLKSKNLVEFDDGRILLTPRGKKVVGVLIKNKIPPFDFQ
jgi:hypothetical protein